jgi:DNA-binding cell septation regulator SpoVG
MAIKKNTVVPAPEVNDRPTLNLTGATIQAAYQLSDTCVVFTLNIPGVSLRDMRLIEKKAGGYFISTPQAKGKDGQYHDRFIVYLSATDEQRVIKAVLDHFAGRNEKRDFKTRYEV